MKKISILISAFAFALCNSQNFEKVFETKLSKKQEYNNFLTWSSQNQVFIKGKEIITKDEENGQVITSLTSFEKKGYLNYTTSLSLKSDLRENKYRLSVSDPVIKVTPESMDYQYMSSAALQRIKQSLESAQRVARNLNNVLDWQYSKVKELKEKKIKELELLNADLKSLTKKREISYKESQIGDVNDDILLLNSVINSVDKLVENIYNDVDKTVNINDDF